VDAQVRAHEAAHLAAAGPYATTGASYSYMIGPDGQRYAVGGSVGVDLSPIPGNPEATVRKMRAIRRAANAPGQPSSADMRVAAKAYRLEQEAQQKIEEQQGGAGAGRAARGEDPGAIGENAGAGLADPGAIFPGRDGPPQPPGSRVDVAA